MPESSSLHIVLTEDEAKEKGYAYDVNIYACRYCESHRALVIPLIYPPAIAALSFDHLPSCPIRQRAECKHTRTEPVEDGKNAFRTYCRDCGAIF